VPSEGGRRGRRDNGLDAAAFVPLVDVDPRVGEHLLDVLASAGVPAFLEPSADVEPYTRALSLPSPPTDRLWVDRTQRREAREIVDAETPHGTRPEPVPRDDEPSHGLTDADEERAWRDIVSAWEAPAVEPVRPSRPRPPAPDPDGPPVPDRPDDADAAGATDPGGPGRRGPDDPRGGRPGTADAGPAGTGGQRRGGPGAGDPRGTGAGDPRGTGAAGPDESGGWRGGGSDDLGGGPDRPDGHRPAGDGADLSGGRRTDVPRGSRWRGPESPEGTEGAERLDGPGGPGPRGKRGKHSADPPRRRWFRRRRTDQITGTDLDRAAEARARAAEDAEDLWLDGPPSYDEGHFEPPPPPPVPRPSRQAILGVLVIFFGIFLLAAPGVVGLDDRTGLTFGVAAVLGGGALLVLRLRETRSDDGPDDGAVV
jgi:hypothetical protein